MEVTRVSVRHEKLCYIITANKVIKYPKGRSRIVYIGTTQKGVKRLASSAAYRAPTILGRYGIVHFDVSVVRCASRGTVPTWRLLERALLITFRRKCGRQPLSNMQGRRMKERNEFDYFGETRIRHIIEDLG